MRSTRDATALFEGYAHRSDGPFLNDLSHRVLPQAPPQSHRDPRESCTIWSKRLRRPLACVGGVCRGAFGPRVLMKRIGHERYYGAFGTWVWRDYDEAHYRRGVRGVLWQRGACPGQRCCGAARACSGRALGVLHRHVCGDAALLPRRQYRPPCRVRHGERRGHERRAGEIPLGRHGA